jgi:hypothetical protein
MKSSDIRVPRSRSPKFSARSIQMTNDGGTLILNRKAPEPSLKILAILALVFLSACSWFHPRAKPPPPPPALVVTGAPTGSIVFVDDAQIGQPAQYGKPQVLTVTAGAHVVEVRVTSADNAGSTVIYSEQTYIASGEKRAIKVLSGSSRE